MPTTMLTVLYLVAGVLFILSLGGLSTQETARKGNTYGIIGMLIAVLATGLDPRIELSTMLLGGMAVGGAIGAYLAANNGDWESVVAASDLAIEKAPNEKEAHLLKAMALIELDNLENAAEIEELLAEAGALAFCEVAATFIGAAAVHGAQQ